MMGLSRSLSTVNSKRILCKKNPKTGFEPRAFAVGIDWAATQPKSLPLVSLSYATINVEEILASITVAV